MIYSTLVEPESHVVTVVRPRPQDSLVLYCDRPLPNDALQALVDGFAAAWASGKTIILPAGLRLVLVEGTAAVVDQAITREMATPDAAGGKAHDAVPNPLPGDTPENTPGGRGGENLPTPAP